MSSQDIQKKVKEMAKELAKGLKTEDDLNVLTRHLMKATIETALESELDTHLGYEKHEKANRADGNSRNGHSRKTLKSDYGDVEIETPRDRE